MTSRSPDPAQVASSLVDLLNLEPVPLEEHLAAPTTVAAFRGDSSPQPGGHVFGGQVMGQAVTAVGRTVPEGRRIHSMYSYFLAPGDPEHPIRFQVDALRDGGSFSVRRVLATQPGRDGGDERTILAMTASFQEQQEGLEHFERAPEAPDPEGLPTTAEVLADIDHPVAQYWATQRPIDIRHVTDPIYLRPDPASDMADAQMVWMRTLAPVNAPALTHDAILAFASDYTPFEPILRRQGLSWITPGLRLATVNHAIWWHQHVDANDWLLYVQRSPSAAGGRGLAQGHMFDRSGALVATVTQEGMIRVKPQQGPA
ncbi:MULTISPECIES: acyl-CoA thioesterase II [unclassified Brachybacterium]|uniref:acyl-CoA thioesterase n=1 Tax=unclassified Brachybacterium TaxID=2623841 RepID=UPI000C7FE6F0|nr:MULTISPECIES: acyl-CoA thioesterase II [unclassified Brachybacterium]PMC75184.1 acyl-CoA thioesterase II [Brachybacterium sp. UMB0905]